jgi:hypothetical protein
LITSSNADSELIHRAAIGSQPLNVSTFFFLQFAFTARKTISIPLHPKTAARPKTRQLQKLQSAANAALLRFLRS